MTMKIAPRFAGWLRPMALAAATASLLVVAGCGPVKLVATTNIPTPLVVKIPVAVAVYVPKEFSSFVHDEERSGTDWHVELGRAQTDGLMRLLNAMFERVVIVDGLNASPQGDVRAILEPSVEEYAFVTPRDAGSPFFAVSIKYRINVYTPDGKLADSWGFTGYGTAPSQGMASDAPLTQATALALRDAGAKLAVEFREQAIVRGLIPESAVPDTPMAPPGSTTFPPAATSEPAPPPAAEPSPQTEEPPAEEAPPPTDPAAEDEEQKVEPAQVESLVGDRESSLPLG